VGISQFVAAANSIPPSSVHIRLARRLLSSPDVGGDDIFTLINSLSRWLIIPDNQDDWTVSRKHIVLTVSRQADRREVADGQRCEYHVKLMSVSRRPLFVIGCRQVLAGYYCDFKPLKRSRTYQFGTDRARPIGIAGNIVCTNSHAIEILKIEEYMLQFRLAAATRLFAQPLRIAVQLASRTGVQGVQLDVRNELKPTDLSETGRRQFLRELDDLGLSVASLNFPTHRTYYTQDQLEARVTATKSALTFAYKLKARVVTARIGRIPADKESPEYMLLVQVLNDLARHGNHVGATFSMTPTNNTPQQISEIISSVSEGPIGVNFDPAIFVMTDCDPQETFSTLHQYVNHVQARDAVRDVDGSGVEVPIGRGEVQWDGLIASINEANYQGWITVDRTAGDDKQGDLTRAAEYLRRVAMEV